MSSLRDNYGRFNRGLPFTSFLTNDGTPTGNPNLNVDGSVTPVEFWAQPPINSVYIIQYIGISITDNGNPNIEDYGNINGGLTNGLRLFIDTKGERDLLEPVFTSNSVYAVRASDGFDITQFAGTDRLISYRDVLGDFSGGFPLFGNDDEKFGVIVQDDLTSLIGHQAVVKGTIKEWNKS